MVARIVNFLFLAYQGIFASRFASCRYLPTCSQYCLEAIEGHGILRGAWLAAKRLAHCHPFSKRPMFDPVPI